MSPAPVSGAGTQPEISVLVIQPTAFCNINCSYCYLPDRDSKHVIAQETVLRLLSEVFNSGWSAPEITVIWHAGEPLVVPVSFYQEVFRAIDAMRPAGVVVHHTLQTNGMLITPAWCDLFRQWDVGVGVSIDGPAPLHDANRRTRSGAGTFEQTRAGIRCLRAHDVPFHVISVLSPASLDMSDAMLDFYLSEGIDQICFNVEESEGQHVSQMCASDALHDRYGKFLYRFWQGARASGQVRFVREIDQALNAVFRPAESGDRNPQAEPLTMINMDSHGNVSSFSPELLGMRNAAYGDFLLGNIHTHTVPEIYRACLDSALWRDIKAGVAACQGECPYFSVCCGGAPVNKLFENGSFASTKTAYCTLAHSVPTDLVLAEFDRLQAALAPGDAAVTMPPAPGSADVSTHSRTGYSVVQRSRVPS